MMTIIITQHLLTKLQYMQPDNHYCDKKKLINKKSSPEVAPTSLEIF